MAKTFKQFVTEVRVGYDQGIPKFKPVSNSTLEKTHTPIHSGTTESGHHVTVARDNKTGQKSVFVHDHKGKHIGTIEAHHTGENSWSGRAPDSDHSKVIHVSKTAVHKEHQGKGIMTGVYKHLINHGHTLRSDGHLSHSAHKMWSKLAFDKKIKFGEIRHWSHTSDKIKKHDPHIDVTPEGEHNEWSHYVAKSKD